MHTDEDRDLYKKIMSVDSLCGHSLLSPEDYYDQLNSDHKILMNLAADKNAKRYHEVVALLNKPYRKYLLEDELVQMFALKNASKIVPHNEIKDVLVYSDPRTMVSHLIFKFS